MRIGLLGGTFNPVHNGHLLLAEGAMKALGLDRVVWIPSHVPPHKSMEGDASPEDRYEMVRMAIQDNPSFEVSRIELDRPAPSYSIDTVRQIREKEKGAELFFLIGSETAQQLSGWRQVGELRGMVTFASVPRPGRASSPVPGVRELPVRTAEVSASEIRRRVREGKPIRDLVPEAVLRYIREKGLYR